MPFKKNYIPWNKGKKLTTEHIEKVRKFRIGKKQSEETKTKISLSHFGLRPSIETRFKMSKSHSGINCWNWKGGISPINELIRGSIEYKLWRESVFIRDNYTCVWCGDRQCVGHKVLLQVDHIKPFALFPELRFAIDNGRTLCIDCHKKTDTYLNNKMDKNVYQLAQ